MPKKIKLNLNALNVESFKTTNQSEVKGGSSHGYDCESLSCHSGNVCSKFCSGDPDCQGNTTWCE